MKFICRLCVLLVAISFVGSSAADQVGRIVGVVDGDTVDFLTAGNVLVRIRLSGIDAPEMKQAFGSEAKRVLGQLAFRYPASVSGGKRDRNGRLVGKITVHGLDVNLQMVRLGYAWHFKKYEKEQPPEDRVLYAQAEVAARARRAGLWVEKNPLAPWDFRAEHRGGANSRVDLLQKRIN